MRTFHENIPELLPTHGKTRGLGDAASRRLWASVAA